MRSEWLLPYLGKPMTTYGLATEVGEPHASVKAQVNALRRAGLVERVSVAICDPALRTRSGKYLVGVFQRRPRT